MFCMKCGEKLAEGDKFCRRCGAPVEPAAPAGAAPASEAGVSPADSTSPAEGVSPADGTSPAENVSPAGVGPDEGSPDAAEFAVPDAASPEYAAKALGETVPAPAGKKRRGALIGIAAGVVVLAAAAAACLLLLGGPGKKFRTLQQNTLLAPAVQMLNKAAETQSGDAAEIDTDGTLTLSGDESTFGDLSSFEMDLHLKSKNGSQLVGADISYGGTAMLSATLTADKDTYGLYIPALDENYYTVRRDALSKLLTNAGEDLASDSDGDEKAEAAGAALDYGELAKSSAGLLDKYGRLALSLATDKNVKKSTETLTIDGKSVKCTVYTLHPTAGDLEKLVSKFGRELQNEKDVQTLYELYSAGAMYSGGSADSLEEFKARLQSAAQNMIDHPSDGLENYEDGSLYWTVAVHGGRIVYEAVGKNGDNSTTLYATYESAGSEKDGRYDELSFSDGWDMLTVSNRFTKTGDKVDGTLEFGDGYNTYSARYSMDLKTRSGLNIPYGSYTLGLDGADADLEVGKGSDGGSTHTLTFTEGSESITLRLDTTDKPSSIAVPDADAVDISNYDSDQLETILSGMEDQLYSVLFSLYA